MLTDNKLSLKWLYIDFNSYFASVEQQLNPKLRGKPVAVVPVDSEFTSVIAASYEAKAFGIKTNTMVRDAKKMCPGLICVHSGHERYVKFHHKILKEVENHIPVTMVCSIDEVACSLMKNEASVERATEIAMSIKKGLAKNVGEYIKCSIGVAPNRYLAKVATDLKKPDGLTFIQHEDIPGKLLGLKLRDLPGIGYNMENRLRLAGIGSIQDIWNMDKKHLRKVWGSIWGERMWYYLRGHELPEEETERRTIGHSHVMGPELRDPKQAYYVAKRLTLKAASRLRRMGYCASALSFSTRIENGERIEGGERFYRANDNKTIIAALDSIWKKAMHLSKGARLKKISVTLHELTPAVEHQPELFESLPKENMKERKRSESLSFAMDKINHKYGRDCILLGMLPTQGKSFSGSKVAFTRIPDIEEFLE